MLRKVKVPFGYTNIAEASLEGAMLEISEFARFSKTAAGKRFAWRCHLRTETKENGEVICILFYLSIFNWGRSSKQEWYTVGKLHPAKDGNNIETETIQQ